MLLLIETVSIIFYGLAGLIALAVIVLLFMKWYITEYTRISKHKKVDLPITASELARANLDRAGLTNIEVVIKRFKSGFNYRRKKLYITKRMERKATVYSVSRVMQLVSLAIIVNTDEKARKTSNNVHLLNYSATALFFIMIIVSIFVELTLSGDATWITLIGLAFTLGFYIFTTVWTIRNGSLLKRANVNALEVIKNMEVFEEKDITSINKLYRMSIKEYNINTLLSVVYVVYYGLKFIFKGLNVFGKRR